MEEIKILPVLYDFMIWYSAKINGFPQKYKYTLGNRKTDIQLTILEQIIEAKYGSKKKAHFLRRANIELEKLRFMIGLSKDLQCINLKTFEHASKQINAIGKMVGGWEKQQKVKKDGAKV